MKMVILGARGIPATYGGFETFAEELAVRLVQRGWNITVVCQDQSQKPAFYKSVPLVYSKYSKAKNPVRFYFDSLKIALKRADLVLVCGVGGAVFYPLLKKSNVILVTHTDGREELRGKYSSLKKAYVRFAQWLTAKYTDYLIADGYAVMDYWKEKFDIPDIRTKVLEFGAYVDAPEDISILKKLHLNRHEYDLVVCRMVPENNLEMIIKGYLMSESKRKLLLVGDVDSEHGKKMQALASHNVVFVNAIYDKPQLAALRKSCFAYIHGHSVGGTNPSLLEAMASANICICHDNPYNRETTAGKMLYFSNEDELSSRLLELDQMNSDQRTRYSIIGLNRIKDYYNWERIVKEYEMFFNKFSG